MATLKHQLLLQGKKRKPKIGLTQALSGKQKTT
jgi:hypothetical protein